MKYSRVLVWVGLALVLWGLAACQSRPMMADGDHKMHHRQMHHMMATTLSGTSEVPPVVSAGAGSIELALNRQTNVLTWTVVYSGLSGPVTGAHLHGPAIAGQNAGVAIPMLGNLTSPFVGAVILSPDQVAELRAGNWYFNLHTAYYPNGEIRGQIAASP
jgi:CHRD domain